MPNEENLKPFNKITEEEQREKARKGGIASGKARKKKKLMRDLVGEYLNKELTGANLKAVKDIVPILGKDVDVQSAIIAGQVMSAIKGNTKGAEWLQELQDKAQPTEDSNHKWHVPITDITSDYVEVYRAVHEAFETGNLREIVNKGGRGSIKSNFWASIAEETIYQDPQAHVVYTRRYKTDLRSSVYNQFIKTITRHKKQDEWEFTTSPMVATYKKTGQQVIFVGCDKPISSKSSTMPFGYVKLMIHEECDEMAGIEQMDNIEDTFLRADTPAIDVKVFNPPKSKNNFMNQYAEECEHKEGTRVFHSYYYNVPVKWLGQRFFDRAEWFKVNKPLYYENNYLGKVTGSGGAIFENLEVREIPDSEIDNMSYFYYGLDWGFTHPQAFTKVAYNEDTDTVYVLWEHVAVGQKQQTFARKIKQFKECEIIADSEAPDKIRDYLDWGFNVVGAVKRWKGGGRDYAWEWLQTVRKIVIDPNRTPKALHEFNNAEHEQLKDGSFSSEYPRLEEDSIMSIIYALNRVIIGSKKENFDYDYEEDDYYEEDE